MIFLEFFESAYFLVFLFCIFLIIAAMLSAAETALISCDRSALRKAAREGSQRAIRANELVQNVEALVTTTQFGINLSVAAATTVATILTVRISGKADDWILFAALTPIILLFCDTIPKVVARAFSETFSLYLGPPVLLLSHIFKPVVYVLSHYTNRISLLFGTPRPDSLAMRKRVRKQILSLLSDRSVASGIKVNQRRMIRNILNFSNQTVRKAMIPLVNVDALAHDAPAQEALQMFQSLRHSRIPVYETRVDNIVGLLHFHSLFECADLSRPVSDFMKEAMYAPEHQQLEALITEMNAKDEYMAIVVDEYGGAIGIITEEDVLEEVVGNLSDEFDESTRNLNQITENSYIVNVNIEISDLNDRLQSSIPKGDYETLAGFLLQQFNRIPNVGDELFYSNLKFLVYRANERAIQSVIITRQRKGRA